MKTILCGKFENAVLRETALLTGHCKPDLSHSYYMSLYRSVPRSYFERSGTFLAISSSTILPSVDWGTSNGSGETIIREEDLGLTRFEIEPPERHADLQTFVALLLQLNALSSNSIRLLSDVPPPSPLPENWRTPMFDVSGVGEVDFFLWSQLHRMMMQVVAARATGSFLVLSDDDRQILSEICYYVAEHRLPMPFDFPDLRSDQLISGERFVAGLLNFAPRDPHSVSAVRRDRWVQSYAERVRHHISSPDGEAKLLEAMRDAMQDSKQSKKVRTVFEVSSWTMKPLSYIPAVGTIVTAFSDLRDLLAKWMERRQSSEEWYLLGSRMQNISVEEYLTRMNNRSSMAPDGSPPE